jgi:DNA-binding MarR family transcriptional regulator
MTENQSPEKRPLQPPIQAYAPAFLALLASKLNDRISSEGARFTATMGLEIPVNTMSTIMALKDSPASVTEIADALNVSHVAAIKTTRILIEKGILVRSDDPADGRRKPLSLTAKGKRVAKNVSIVIEKAQIAYRQLFDEIGVDVHEALLKMDAALDRISFDKRLAQA